MQFRTPLEPVQSQLNPVDTLTGRFFKIHFQSILISTSVLQVVSSPGNTLLVIGPQMLALVLTGHSHHCPPIHTTFSINFSAHLTLSHPEGGGREFPQNKEQTYKTIS
jgi:hypothetical protein